MSTNNAYAKLGLGGGALDQELFKKKQTPPAEQDERSIERQEKPVNNSPALTAKSVKRKQISAYLYPEQVQTLKSLYFTLNNNLTTESEIEKSDIVALGIDCISVLVGTQVPECSNTQELRTALLDKLSKYLGTQVPES